jgi:hypothetical protein
LAGLTLGLIHDFAFANISSIFGESKNGRMILEELESARGKLRDYHQAVSGLSSVVIYLEGGYHAGMKTVRWRNITKGLFMRGINFALLDDGTPKHNQAYPERLYMMVWDSGNYYVVNEVCMFVKPPSTHGYWQATPEQLDKIAEKLNKYPNITYIRF